MDFCMACVGFWVGVVFHFFCPITSHIIKEGLFYLGVGWLMSRIEEATTRLG